MMNEKILVAYASRAGSTQGVAEAIGKLPSFSDRLKFRLSVLLGVWKEGDHRDWVAIRAWAEGVEPMLIFS